MKPQTGFGSDNHSGIHPELMQALADANCGHVPSYGTDHWSHLAIAKFKEHFGSQCEVFFVFNGTAANALAALSIADSFNSILCANSSHLNVDECGAPELFFGGKLIAIPATDGKISVASLDEYLIRSGDQHFSQISALSLTQPTELGTVYSLEELIALCQWAKKHRLLIHMDGARLSNAAVYLNLDFYQFTTALGVDILSFGGTKNGLIYGEAIVFLNPSLAKNFKFFRKQHGQLPSKTRFIGASFARYLDRDLWKEIAQHSTQMAKLLERELAKFPSIKITRAVESNAVFVIFPKEILKPLRDQYFFYIWDEKTFECRLMMSWDTRPSDIHGFIEKLTNLLKQTGP